MLLELRDNSSSVADMINQIEWIRKQIYDLYTILKYDKNAASIISEGQELDQNLIAVEENLVELKLTGGSQDWLRWPTRFHAKLSSLAGSVGSTDFPPTTQQIEVHEMYKEQLANYKNQLSELLNKDLPDFNNLLKEKNIPNIIARTL
jgi:hypothetical protein